MKKHVTLLPLISTLSVAVVLLAAGCSSDDPDLARLRELAAPPPSSLDRFYPPTAPAPTYLIEMFNLAGPLEGIGVDLQEQDIQGIKTNYQAFQTQYRKSADMVPEWKNKFPEKPVTELGTAIDSGDPAKIGPAMAEVGKLCGDCHAAFQVKVQQRYHWKNVAEIKVKDPLTGQEMEYVDFMWALAGPFSGITVNLREGQVDNARKNFDAFSARFDTMATETCKDCHSDPSGKEIPRKYYVDDEMKAVVSQLGQALEAPSPDAAMIEQLTGAIGNASCVGCHFVHFPAQRAKDNWETDKDLWK
jgi:hypothetical protein